MYNAFFQIEYNEFFLEPLRLDDPKLFEIQAQEIDKRIFNLFNNPLVIKHHPEKIVTCDSVLAETQIGYNNSTLFNHFLFDSNFDRFVGIISLISPKGIEEMYPNLAPIFQKYNEYNDTWIIEYWLNNSYWRKGIMSKFIPFFCNLAFVDSKAKSITALCNPENISSIKLATKVGFKKVGHFTATQHHYLLTRLNLKI